MEISRPIHNWTFEQKWGKKKKDKNKTPEPDRVHDRLPVVLRLARRVFTWTNIRKNAHAPHTHARAREYTCVHTRMKYDVTYLPRRGHVFMTDAVSSRLISFNAIHTETPLPRPPRPRSRCPFRCRRFRPTLIYGSPFRGSWPRRPSYPL